LCFDNIGVDPALDLRPVKQGKFGRPASTADKLRRPGLTSATKKGGTTPGKYNTEQTDKIYDLERENTSLKSKENLLEAEITKMKTKLRRIDELMKKRSNHTGSQALLPAEVQRQLQDEINKMSGENEQMKERNKKLRAIEKELNIKNAAQKAPANKFAHVKGKLGNSRLKKSDEAFRNLVDELRS